MKELLIQYKTPRGGLVGGVSVRHVGIPEVTELGLPQLKTPIGLLGKTLTLCSFIWTKEQAKQNGSHHFVKGGIGLTGTDMLPTSQNAHQAISVQYGGATGRGGIILLPLKAAGSKSARALEHII
jgi:hypothetical protein